MRRLRWMVRRPCFLGLVMAVLFFTVTLTPSLVPRSWSVQGVLAGLTAAIGYGVGTAISWGLRMWSVTEPSAAARRRAWRSLAVGGPLLMLLAVWQGGRWDRELRVLMDMDVDEPWHDVGTVLVALLTAGFLVLVGRAVFALGIGLVGLVRRLLPPRVALGVGAATTVLVVAVVFIGGVQRPLTASIEAGSLVADGIIDPDLDEPTSPLRSGSPDSLISWEELGAKGRSFVTEGPTVAELEEFSGRPAVEPIRLYAGLRVGGDSAERTEVLLAEMDRVDAWSRTAIVIQTPSGNGEIPRRNAAAPEYLLAGDVAQVALQYSTAPSFSTILIDREAGNVAGRTVVRAVADRIATLPDADRPALYVSGESLGSSSTEAAFADLADMAATIDGALMIGPTFFNPVRNELTADRDAATPVWLPVVDDGSVARFAREPEDLDAPSGTWEGSRIVYLQNSSDPVSWFDFDVLWSSPEFLESPRGPDVSPSMRWFPVVTFWQLVLDLPFASAVPGGHGHRFGVNAVDGWAAVIDPVGWSAEDTARLRALLE